MMLFTWIGSARRMKDWDIERFTEDYVYMKLSTEILS